MFNKILIGVGFLLGAILVIENLVVGSPSAILFLKRGVYPGTVALVSIFIGIGMGYGIRGIIFDRKNIVEDNDNF